MSDDSYRMVNDLLSMDRSINEAMYDINRYQVNGYDHIREDALKEIEMVKEIAEETLERYGDE